MRHRVLGVAGQRLIEVLQSAAEILLGPPVPEVPSLEIEGIGLEIVGRRLYQDGLLLPEQPHPEGSGDGTGDLVLNGEHVLRIPVVGVGPEEIPVGHVDQLGREPESPAGAPDAALEHGADLEPSSDRPDVFQLALECEGRCPGHHMQPADLRQRIDQLVGHSIGEVLVLGVGTQVGEGEHRDGLLGRRRSGHRGRAFAGNGHVP